MPMMVELTPPIADALRLQAPQSFATSSMKMPNGNSLLRISDVLWAQIAQLQHPHETFNDTLLRMLIVADKKAGGLN